MNCGREMMTLYAITDRKWTNEHSLYEQVEAALKGGATCIQLREKELDDESFLKEAIELKKLCHKYSVPLIINDNIDIMLQSDADGVHVGQDDTNVKEARERIGNSKILGVSCHNKEEAIKAVEDGADYLGVGSVFETHTKNNVVHLTHEILKDITSSVNVPVVAIGGINQDNIMQLKGTGVDGVALVSAIFSAKNIKDQTNHLYRLSKQMSGGLKMKTALTIAGSDCSGGAGIQADLKTMTMNGVYAMSAITALTAQNTTGVSDIMEVTPEFLKEQLDMVFTDIYPDAVKIGMVSSSLLIEVIADKLKEYHAENIVVDPVMIATSGAQLISNDAIETLETKLLPLATVVTPNIPEAEKLAEMKITNEEDMIAAAKKISEEYHCAVLVKGGHHLNDANDLLYKSDQYTWFYGIRIDNPNTHGTGCTLSSAIASNLAKGYTLEQSVKNAKDYLSGALADMLDLGKGSGPMNHAYLLKK